MFAGLERRHAVVDEAGGTAPNRDVAALQTEAAHGIGAALAAPQKHSGQAERDRDDGRPGILLVTILMQPEFGAGGIAVDQAGVGIVGGEPGIGGGA